MKLAPTAAMLQSRETLIPAFTQAFPAAVVYSNAAAIGLKAFANRMLQGTYPPYTGSFEAVELGAFPAGIRLLGGHSYWLEWDGTLAAEQINPLIPDVPANYESLLALPAPTETITGETVLVARFGDVTWGHWVAEILPRAIMAEHTYPGRFSFALADQILTNDVYGSRILETLAAYGIAAERILPLRFNAHYRFENLFTVINLWSAAGMNPQLMQIMRDDIAPSPPMHNTGRLAVLRRDSKTRNLANLDEIIPLLQAKGFTIIDTAGQSFLNQVGYFRDSHTLFGVLGSGLIGLIYAPEAINAATVGPAGWDDTYFHRLIQLRHGAHADIRCPVIWSGEGLERDAPLVAIPSHVQAGLAALERPEAERAPGGILEIGGARLRRHVGRTLLHADFSAAGMGQVFLHTGWAGQEPDHIWSVGQHSSLKLPRPFETEDIELQLEVIALVDSDHLVARALTIIVNGIRLASHTVAGHARISTALPAACFSDDLALDITFEHPFCIAAAVTGHGPDERPLGLGFISLSLVSFAPPPNQPPPALQRIQEKIAGAA